MKSEIMSNPEITVQFGDLSLPLKIAVIISYIAGILMSFSFILGFIKGATA